MRLEELRDRLRQREAVPKRWCRQCHSEATLVVTDKDGLQWFACGMAGHLGDGARWTMGIEDWFREYVFNETGRTLWKEVPKAREECVCVPFDSLPDASCPVHGEFAGCTCDDVAMKISPTCPLHGEERDGNET